MTRHGRHLLPFKAAGGALFNRSVPPPAPSGLGNFILSSTLVTVTSLPNVDSPSHHSQLQHRSKHPARKCPKCVQLLAAAAMLKAPATTRYTACATAAPPQCTTRRQV